MFTSKTVLTITELRRLIDQNLAALTLPIQDGLNAALAPGRLFAILTADLNRGAIYLIKLKQQSSKIQISNFAHLQTVFGNNERAVSMLRNVHQGIGATISMFLSERLEELTGTFYHILETKPVFAPVYTFTRVQLSPDPPAAAAPSAVPGGVQYPDLTMKEGEIVYLRAEYMNVVSTNPDARGLARIMYGAEAHFQFSNICETRWVVDSLFCIVIGA